MSRASLFGCAVAALVGLSAAGTLEAQSRPSYDFGRHVSPAFEGWVQNADGTIDILFGYMNGNWEEVVHVPVGQENRFLTGSPDRGQPTEFLPRRNRFVFRVRWPEGLTVNDELVWELSSRGVTQRAYASIKPDFKVDNIAIMSETGALGPGQSNERTRSNQPPVIELEGATERTARVGETVTLAAVVRDDGIPTRGRGASGPAEGTTPQQLLQRALSPVAMQTVQKTNSLHLTWFPYRGAGRIDFQPAQVKPWEDTRPFANSPWAPFWVAPRIPEDGRWVTQVTFQEPGDYVLRGRADDGGLLADVEVTFRVR